VFFVKNIFAAAFLDAALFDNAAVFTVENHSLMVRYDDAHRDCSVGNFFCCAGVLKSGKLKQKADKQHSGIIINGLSRITTTTSLSKISEKMIMNKDEIPMAEYQQFAKEFDSTNFNADAWVKTAKDAGMK